MKWWKAALGLERDGVEGKNVIGLNDGIGALSVYDGASRQDGDNFRTNRVTLAEYDDNGGAGSRGVLALAAVWACVNLLAGTVASLPLMVYRTRNGSREPATDHPLYYVLHDSPNADQTALDFWEFTQASLELQGNSYSFINRGSLGRVVALSPPLSPEMVTVRRLSSGDLEYRWRDQVGQSHTSTQDDLLHIRGFGGSPLGGLSTLAFGRRTFGIARSIENAAGQTFRNGVRASGTMETDLKLDGKQRGELETALQDKFVGSTNAGRPMLLDNGMKWKPISINPDDAQMLESRGFSVEEICRFFGVPPHMVGHTDNSTSWGTGLEQQTLGFVKFTLRRRLKRIEQSLMKQLLTAADRVQGVTIEFNLEGLLRGDSGARSAFYTAALGDTQKPGWMVRNEVRALENLAPIDGWDEPIPLISEGPAPLLPGAAAASGSN